MTATKPVPLYLVDDDKTVLAPPPTFLEEDAVTKVSLQRMRSVPPPPPIVVPMGDEPTRIVEVPVRPIAERAGALVAPPNNEVSTLVTRGRSPLRFAMVALALVIAGLLGTLWRRAQTVPPQHAVATTPAATSPTPLPTPVAKVDPPTPAVAAPPPPVTPAIPAPLPIVATPATPTPMASNNDERAAVEAVASGSFAQAAKLYQALADAHPSNDAYRVAARILLLDRSKESAR